MAESFLIGKSKFFIEAYFVKLNTDNYYLNSIDKNRINLSSLFLNRYYFLCVLV